MDQLRNLLTWNASVWNPAFLALVLCFITLLTMLFVARPRLYLPLFLFTAPLPKLFTIASYSDTLAGGYVLNAAPGFSVVDLVLAAGILTLFFRRWHLLRVPASRSFVRALVLWSASVLFSVLIGLLFWSETYRPVFAVYAARYVLTLASFVIAAQFGVHENSERSVRKLLHQLAIAGNATIALGLLYYFEFGSSIGGTRGVQLAMEGGSATFRTYLWFFDYSDDMGYYASLIAVLNVILLSDRRFGGHRLMNAAGLLGCVTTVLLIGERANVLVAGAALAYFLWETSRLRHRSVRVSIAFQAACVLAVILAFGATMSVISPEFISNKFEHSVGEDTSIRDSAMEVMETAGVPQVLSSTAASLPIGDFAYRLALSTAGLWYFFAHPGGVGFWGQLDAAGFYSHHEFITIAIEQGVLGLAALLFFLIRLRRLLWSAQDLPGAPGQLGVLMRSISVGLFAAMVMANTVLLDMKFALVYWTLVGVWSVVPRNLPRVYPAVAVSAPQPRRLPAQVEPSFR